MRAMHWGEWLSRARSHWVQAHPHCADRDCNVGRRMWRRFGWWHGRIRLWDSFYCAPRCFENAARQCFSAACISTLAPCLVRHRVPLGLLMLSRGQLSHAQLRAALQAQQGIPHHRIGEWLDKLGFATEQQVTAALGLQWACPVLAWKTPPNFACARLLPYRLLERFRMLPVQFVSTTRVFYVAFCDGIDYAVLYAIEQMLDCHTEACLISRSSMDRELERMGHEARAGDLLFESWHDPAAMAHITCGYALKLGADQVRIVTCGEYIWVRLEAGRDVTTLLFRRPLTALAQAHSSLEDPSLACEVAG
jgi:Type II secretion system (T2SS), protein E, N-terminal domain